MVPSFLECWEVDAAPCHRCVESKPLVYCIKTNKNKNIPVSLKINKWHTNTKGIEPSSLRKIEKNAGRRWKPSLSHWKQRNNNSEDVKPLPLLENECNVNAEGVEPCHCSKMNETQMARVLNPHHCSKMNKTWMPRVLNPCRCVKLRKTLVRVLNPHH